MRTICGLNESAYSKQNFFHCVFLGVSGSGRGRGVYGLQHLFLLTRVFFSLFGNREVD